MDKVLRIIESITVAQDDRSRMLERICLQAMELTAADGATIEFAEDGHMVYRSAVGLARKALGLRVPIAGSLSGMAVRTGEILVCKDSERDPRVDRVGCRKVGLRSMVVAPLRQDGQRVAILKVLAARPYAFGQRDQTVLRLLSGFFSAAMLHSEDFERVRELTRTSNEALARAREEQSLRENFASALGHDIRTPLSVIKLNLQLIARKAGDASPLAPLVRRGLVNANRVQLMIDELLEINRLHSGKEAALRPEECDLSEKIHETVQELQSLYPGRFVARINGPVHGCFDSRAVQRILENLGDNAIKYGDPSAEITVEFRGTPQGALLSVHNWGEPIPLELQTHLFEPFNRQGSPRVGERPGWGIGLMVVKTLTEAHGGSVTVKSGIEGGTRFEVELKPLSRKDAAA